MTNICVGKLKDENQGCSVLAEQLMRTKELNRILDLVFIAKITIDTCHLTSKIVSYHTYSCQVQIDVHEHCTMNV